MKIKFFRKIIIFSTFFLFVSIFVFILFYRNKPYIIILNNYAAGRLGDQIIGYSKAKWLSYKYGIPFRLIPFKYCDQLHISNEQDYTSKSYFFNRVFYKLFGRLVWVDTEEDLVKALKELKGPTRFVAHINTRLYEHMKNNAGTNKNDYSWVTSVLYEIMLQNPNFCEKLREKLKPIAGIDRIKLPKDKITVAIHIRKGGGFDSQLLSKQYFNDKLVQTCYEQLNISLSHEDLSRFISKNIPSFDYDKENEGSADKIYLDKFLPEQYYVNQLQNLSRFLNHAPMYVFIFTDDTEPEKLLKRIKNKTNKTNIVFDCRAFGNRHDSNVIYDLYAMADFDCLIRSGSCFAYISQMLGNHKIIIYPLHLKWVNKEVLVADCVGVIVRDEKLCQKRFAGAS